MEIALSAACNVIWKFDETYKAYPAYVAGSTLMGAGIGLIASHLVSVITPTSPIVSAVYGSIAHFISALFIFPTKALKLEAGILAELHRCVVSFAIPFFAISLGGINFSIVSAILVASVIVAVNLIFTCTIAAIIALTVIICREDVEKSLVKGISEGIKDIILKSLKS